MTVLPPLPVAVPLLVAAGLTAASIKAGRRFSDGVAIATSGATVVACAILLGQSMDESVVHWFGGWTPRHGVALGISFFVDPTAATMACLTAVLVTMALVFSARYFEEVGTLFPVLMLVYLGAAVGFSFSGDIFNLFVFLELMSVSAFALTGFRIERAGPIQGALNFAVTNSLGAFLVLAGIGLLYGRTGALNLAQIGETLRGADPNGLVVTAFTLLTVGLFVKAAVVPFHFWLADAYAVAPTPVAVILAGVQAELALFAVARIYWTVFSSPMEGGDAIRPVLLAAGLVTAFVGAAMCWFQGHIKRLLAFGAISHLGLYLCGVAVATSAALGGSLIYVVGDGFVKAALFICAGIIASRLGDADEADLHGEGRGLPITGCLVALGALGLAGMPPFASFYGKSLIEEEAGLLGFSWITPIFIAVSAVTAGAVLRFAARVFLGIGSRAGEPSLEQRSPRETGPPPIAMLVPAAALVAAGLGFGLVPELGARAEASAELLQDRRVYAAAVLSGEPHEFELPGGHTAPTGSGVLFGLLSCAGAVGLSAAALFGSSDRAGTGRFRGAGRGTIAYLRRLHSGHVGDYVAWLTLGVAVFGGAFALVLS